MPELTGNNLDVFKRNIDDARLILRVLNAEGKISDYNYQKVDLLIKDAQNRVPIEDDFLKKLIDKAIFTKIQSSLLSGYDSYRNISQCVIKFQQGRDRYAVILEKLT